MSLSMHSSTRFLASSRLSLRPSAVVLTEASQVGGSSTIWRLTTEPRNARPISSDQPSHDPRPHRFHSPRLPMAPPLDSRGLCSHFVLIYASVAAGPPMPGED